MLWRRHSLKLIPLLPHNLTCRNTTGLLTAALLLVSNCWGEEKPISYVREVKPLLDRKCLICHQTDNPSGHLSFSCFEAFRKGGKSGAAFESGNPEQSLILRMITGNPPRMPMGGEALTGSEVAMIRSWISQGARNDAADLPLEDSTWWSLKSIRKPPVPAPRSSWGHTPIDAFILSHMLEKGLSPSPEADRRTLIRRVTYDLIGLPPTPEEVRQFQSDPSRDAYDRLVDRLLASPRYGERWGRHWLDVIHYGDSHGYDKDKPRPNAWPYRDYVIASFNSDKTYSRFVEEQVAGDILFPEDPQGIVATGFIAAGPWDYVGHAELREGTVDKKIARLLDRDDMVMTMMSTFVSMTVHCARCHNHKFDPIPQSDYYRLQAVFSGVDRADRPYDYDPALNRQRQLLMAEKRRVQVDLQPIREAIELTNSEETRRLDEEL